jgi:hypothetical protein
VFWYFFGFERNGLCFPHFIPQVLSAAHSKYR